MKKLIFLALLIPLIGQAQILPLGRIYDIDTIGINIHPNDTIPVFMMVSDTTANNNNIITDGKTIYQLQGLVWYIRGYEVLRWKSFEDYWNPRIDESGQVVAGYYVTDKYLDSNKKPVKYLVWMSFSQLKNSNYEN